MPSSRKKITALYLGVMTAMLVQILWFILWRPDVTPGGTMFLPSVFTVLFMVLTDRPARRPADRQEMLPALGILLVMASDFFLCLLGGRGVSWARTVGYAMFSIVEIVFAVWLGCGKKILLVRVLICLAAEGLPFLLNMVSLANAIALINLSQLAVNVVCAWRRQHLQPTKQNLLFGIGISLFAGCDYSILIRTLLPAGGVIYTIAETAVWLCYIPCQVMIVFSWLSRKES